MSSEDTGLKISLDILETLRYRNHTWDVRVLRITQHLLGKDFRGLLSSVFCEMLRYIMIGEM